MLSNERSSKFLFTEGLFVNNLRSTIAGEVHGPVRQGLAASRWSRAAAIDNSAQPASRDSA